MAKAMTYPDVIGILMDGGWIFFTDRVCRASKIKVVRHIPGKPIPYDRQVVGHISLSQFEALCHAGILEVCPWQAQDDKGNEITTFFVLRRPCEGLRERWEEIKEDERGN